MKILFVLILAATFASPAVRRPVGHCVDCPKSVCIGNQSVRVVPDLLPDALMGDQVYISRGQKKGFYVRLKEWELVPTTEYTVNPYRFPCGNEQVGVWHQSKRK